MYIWQLKSKIALIKTQIQLLDSEHVPPHWFHGASGGSKQRPRVPAVWSRHGRSPAGQFVPPEMLSKVSLFFFFNFDVSSWLPHF